MDNLEDKTTQAPMTDNPDTNADTNDANDLTKERWKQQLNGSKAEAEKYRQMALENEVAKAKTDANSLLELNKKDPKLANEVAKQFGYSNFEDAKKTIVKPASTDGSSGFTEEMFEEMYQKRKQKEEHEKAIEKAEQVMSSLDEGLQEKARSYFKKISSGQTLDAQTALEFAEMATLYVSKDKLKSDKFNEGIAQLGSTGLSNSKTVKESDVKQDYIIRGGKLILNTNK